MSDAYSVTAQQDALRPMRMFVGALTGALLGADQSNAGQDAYAYGVPSAYAGYQVVGPYSYSQEGRPIATTPSGGLVISPMVIMLGIGAAAVLLAKG
ncbi:hypothetical protein [Acidovorax sp. LjRoot194]|uniref:hypothetical protein n=1 Tax=Acidovorax sp. LjRoot194 TaxID=3342280 RepID=UPI003ECE2145